jgi:hypothetical protein
MMEATVNPRVIRLDVCLGRPMRSLLTFNTRYQKTKLLAPRSKNPINNRGEAAFLGLTVPKNSRSATRSATPIRNFLF